MPSDKTEALQLLQVLARRGLDLEVEFVDPGDGERFKVVPAGGDYFSAPWSSKVLRSWREVAVYLEGTLDSVERIAEAVMREPLPETRATVLEGRRWWIVLPDGETFDSVHGAYVLQVPEDADAEDARALHAQAVERVGLCELLADRFVRGGGAC